MGRIAGLCRRSAISFSASPTANPVGTKREGESCCRASSLALRAASSRVFGRRRRDLTRSTMFSEHATRTARLTSSSPGWMVVDG
jgi:hypothetical protein